MNKLKYLKNKIKYFKKITCRGNYVDWGTQSYGEISPIDWRATQVIKVPLTRCLGSNDGLRVMISVRS